MKLKYYHRHFILSFASLFLITSTSSTSNILQNSNIDFQNSKIEKTYKETVSKESIIEKDFNIRLRNLGFGYQIKQFGYDFFKTAPALPSKIVVPDTYKVGPGDELFLYFIGVPPDKSDFPPILKLEVDRRGYVYIPTLGVFPVVGLTLKEVEKLLAQSLGVNLKVSIGTLRTYPVYVSGEVNKPGMVLIQATYTPVEVFALAGGIKKTGSLRNILLKTRNSTLRIDLYNLLIKGESVDTFLPEGSILLVKPIGSVVGIAGAVKRPAIYEVDEGTTLSEVINLAGGVLPSAYTYTVLLQRYENNSLKLYEGSLTDYNFIYQPIKNGDLIVIRKTKGVLRDVIIIKGPIAYTGPFQYKPGLTLTQVLKKDWILPETNTEYAEIKRYDPETFTLKEVIKFRPVEVLNGKRNYLLQPLDEIVFYPKYAFKPIEVSGEILNPKKIPYKAGLKLSEALAEVKFKYPVDQLKVVVFRNGNPIGVVYLYNLLKQGDKARDLELQPGDNVLVKRIKNTEIVAKVSVYGYVNKPGVYKIDENTRLYDVLKAAGGFKSGAYPEGIIVLRKSVAKMQKEKLHKAILLLKQELDKEEAGILQADIPKEQAEAYKWAFEAKRRLLDEMIKTQVTGRIAGLKIPRNLEKLKSSPYNIKLENGDQIFVPPEPSTVLVFGEVHNPVALVYRPGLKVKDYIELAGGFTKYADKENIFVIKANGEAYASSTSRNLIEWDSEKKRFVWGWAKNDILEYEVRPGDAIIVPTKIKVPIFWRPLIRDVVQIIYQSALTVYTISKL